MKKRDRQELVWKELKVKVEALITRRINLFQDALVERGQIKPMPVATDPNENPTKKT